jgi:hypothetical protein
MTSQSPTTQQKSPFLALPAEIRLIIYKHYLALNQLNLRQIGPHRAHLRLTNPFHALQLTCRTMNSELTPLYLYAQHPFTIALNPFHLHKAQPYFSAKPWPRAFATVQHLIFTDIAQQHRHCGDLRVCRNLRSVTVRCHEVRRKDGVGEQWNGSCKDFGRTGVDDVHPSVEAHAIHGIDRKGGLWRRVVGAKAKVVGVVNTCNVREDVELALPREEMVGALLLVVSGVPVSMFPLVKLRTRPGVVHVLDGELILIWPCHRKS